MNPHQLPPPYHPSSSDPASNYRGAWVMVTPVPPSSYHSPANPYVQYDTPQPRRGNIDDVRNKLNSWSCKAETTAANIWNNLKAGQSVTGSAWGKMNVMAKSLTEGGFESLYKQNFKTYPNEKLNRTFACYLSTSTGPVAGTLYLSNIHVAFCSDRTLSSIQPNGMEAWIYYKVIIPLKQIANVNTVTMSGKKQIDKYIQICTIDDYEFWFMGFVNHDKAYKHLLNSVDFSTSNKSIPLSP